MRYCLSLCLCLLFLGGCGRVSIQEQQAFVFGTRIELQVVADDPDTARRAIASVLQEFDRLHRTFHAWQDSELNALNAAIFAGRPQQVSDELANFILDSQAIAKSSDYLFDPGIGQLVKLWGFHADEFTPVLPAPAALESLRAAQPSIRHLQVVDQRVSSTNQAVAIDFGGYLKGVALDRAAAILHQQGLHHALINIGGNVMALGSKQGRPWRVGIQHPRQPGPLATIELADGEAIGTSGDYQRYFELAGERYPHLLDPRNGYPAQHTQAVTVVLPAGTRAGSLSDALSKPIFIAGPDEWRAMAQQLQVAWVLRVDQSGQIEITEALSRRLKFVGSQQAFRVLP